MQKVKRRCDRSHVMVLYYNIGGSQVTGQLSMNEIVSQEVMRINSKVSDCLLHISKLYRARMGYIYPKTLLEDHSLNITPQVTSGPTKILLEVSPTKF